MKIRFYNIDQLIRNKTNNKQKAYYHNQECAIIEGKLGVVVAYFDCRFNSYQSTDYELSIETLDIDAPENQTMADDYMEISIREIMQAAPSRQINSDDFFHKRDYNFAEQRKYLMMLQALFRIDVEDHPFKST